MAVVASLHQDGGPDRLPPQNFEAEVSVLGAVLITETALDQVQLDVGLRPEDVSASLRAAGLEIARAETGDGYAAALGTKP